MINKIFISGALIASNIAIINNTYNSTVSVDYSIQRSSDNVIEGFDFLGGTNFTKTIDEKWGYVYYNLNIYRTKFTDNSNLYLVHTVTDFTPGYQAVANDESGYTDHYLDNGYIHMKAYKYDSDNGRNGGDVKLKTFWPRETDFSTTFSSSFGSSLTVNDEINGGANLSDGVSLGVKGGSSLSLSFNKSVAITYEEPILSSQLSSSNSSEVQWYFELTDTKSVHKAAGSVTYSLETYYLFEMDNYSYNNCSKDAFCLDYTVYMENVDYGLFNIKLKKDSSYSIKIYCFTN